MEVQVLTTEATVDPIDMPFVVEFIALPRIGESVILPRDERDWLVVEVQHDLEADALMILLEPVT